MITLEGDVRGISPSIYNMIQLCSLASGSSGNCVYVGSQSAHILIDVGISAKRVEAGLASIDVDPKSIQGILITHEHSDHIKGLGVMARRYKKKIYVTEKTWEALKKQKNLGKIDESLICIIRRDEPFMIEDMMIHPFKTSHDAADSVCYTFDNETGKIGFATDLGFFDDYIINYLKNSNILYIEANHDQHMLEAGSYPYYLKRRILGDLGHLSNDLSSALIEKLIHVNLEHIILAHLSHENNTPDVAYITIKDVVDDFNNRHGKNVKLMVAKRDLYSDAVKLT